MLYSKFAKTAFASHLLLFIVFPFTSYQHPQGVNDPVEDAKACAVPAPVVTIKLNKNAVKFVRSYLDKNTDDLIKIKERSAAPFKTMDQIFTKYNLPTELKYLAVIESELNPAAVSRVGAVGPWQLMPATAKILGLKVSARNDERRQFYKSTKAAAIYLRDLYTEFDDWLLVMAAYNCGPGPVYTAIKKSGSRNFWKLQAYLPEESRDHVKKFIATHYYFEGNGSVTTLTHAENIKYAQLMIAARDKSLQMQKASQDTLSKITMASFAGSIAYGSN